jgi:hypothetical protein
MTRAAHSPDAKLRRGIRQSVQSYLGGFGSQSKHEPLHGLCRHIVAGISGPDHGNTNAAERSYSAQAAMCVVAVIANAGAIGVLAFSRLPVHLANTKANNRAMILIRAIPIRSVTPLYRLCIGGFLPRRFVHVRFGHADGLRWWRGRGPTHIVLETHRASGRLIAPVPCNRTGVQHTGSQLVRPSPH